MIGYETVGLLYFGFSMEQTVDLLYSGLKHLVYSILGSFYLGTDTNAEYKWILALLITLNYDKHFGQYLQSRLFQETENLMKEGEESIARDIWRNRNIRLKFPNLIVYAKKGVLNRCRDL